MKICTHLFSTLILFSLSAENVLVRSSLGELHVVNIESNDNFLTTLNLLNDSFGSHNEYVIDFMSSNKESIKDKSKVHPSRDYYQSLTSDEKKDIKYIVTTLGMYSLISISGEKSGLKRAGKRVDHLHPLKFLTAVFIDEESKAAMVAMEGRSWVWSEFIDGIKESFEVETSRDNMKVEFLNDFAKRVNISTDIIAPFFNQRDWYNFIVTLIHNVPRNTDTRRYNDV